jgi:hypothetical protein
MLVRMAVCLIALATLAAPAPAQKKPSVQDFPFWSAPKNPHASAFVPRLQEALQLTPEQIEKIVAARTEILESPEISNLKSKGDPNATADELATAGAKRAEAWQKLHKEVSDILTNDQKALIEKVNDAYARTAADVSEEFQPKFGAAKGNAEDTAAVKKEFHEALMAAFNKKLDTILTADQRAAVQKAAEEEAKRAAENKGKVKPNK